MRSHPTREKEKKKCAVYGATHVPLPATNHSIWPSFMVWFSKMVSVEPSSCLMTASTG